MADFEKDQSGRYVTDGLSAKDFNRVFNHIHKHQRKARRSARRTLTPAMMRNKDAEAFMKLGKKKDGRFFTADDMKQFMASRTAHREQFKGSVPGITYNQLVAQSASIDVKRASNKVTDGTGITSAAFVGLQHNLAIISVKASAESPHAHHRVKIRFEAWDQAVEDIGDEKKRPPAIARALCADRVSFDCDCGRHQYWYRYMATAGNYAVAPPKEYAFPKIRNPELAGVACKHVLHAITRFQSSVWQRKIADELQKAAKQVAFGDDKRKTAQFFSDDEQKKLARNRTATTDQKKAQDAFARYQAAQKSLDKKLKTSGSSIDLVRKQLSKMRKSNQATRAALAKEKARREALEKQLKDKLALQKQAFMDAMKLAGIDDKEAAERFRQWMENEMKKAAK